ncbi:PaaI family thioesterase [Falsigemmobacter faecalis]|uniref:PaaI family thioesterase n=1 Tax=Falsigemmobacter faecalis TaxID=2488730 RepID=A0A3P3DLP7_9RHOB|nr:PaaI family thioesterase [Falsigemmobacter faecalis]RRH75170.1 PaaI family thioesterase [Falsigemmobacter faecalis]
MTEPRYAQTPADLPDLAQTLQMSGLEFMQKVLAGDLPAPPISNTLSFGLHEVAEGRAVFRGQAEFAHCNPMGGVHGGWYGTILDSAMACACMTTVPKGHWYTTLEYKVNIVRPLPVGLMVECIGEVQHSGRATAVSRGEIRGLGDGKLYATGSTTCIIMKG